MSAYTRLRHERPTEQLFRLGIFPYPTKGSGEGACPTMHANFCDKPAADRRGKSGQLDILSQNEMLAGWSFSPVSVYE
jgi:hypothetical protein